MCTLFETSQARDTELWTLDTTFENQDAKLDELVHLPEGGAEMEKATMPAVAQHSDSEKAEPLAVAAATLVGTAESPAAATPPPGYARSRGMLDTPTLRHFRELGSGDLSCTEK